MPMILAMNGAELDRGSFGDFGAAARSQSVADLQSALVALGKGIRDGVLMKVAVDGLIGPKTTAAVNRAMTVHLGVGQAPANLRTGSLSQQVVVSQADTLTDLITTEIRRRGFSAPAAKKVSSIKPKVSAAVKAKAAADVRAASMPTAYVPATSTAVAPAVSPVYRVPASAPSAVGGMDMNSIVKWSAIGVGVIVVAGIAYYALAAKKSPRLAGFAGEGERGGPFRRDDAERENWVSNDEGLYNWYQSETRRRGSGGMRGFIRRNRAEIDAAIDRVLNRGPR